MENLVHFELLGYRWSVKPEFAGILKEQVIPLVLSGTDSPLLRPIKQKPVRDSFIVSVDDATPDFFVKLHKYEKPAERLKTIFRASRARAEWELGEQMREFGLPVAEPLGVGERRSRTLVSGCVLIQRAIDRCETLGNYLSRNGGEPSLLKSLGQLLRQMHSSGFWHPDLHTGNILVDPQSEPPKLWLIDLHAAGRSASVSRRRRMADLAKLVFSLQGYLEERQLRELLASYLPDSQRKDIEQTFASLLSAAERLRRRRLRSRSKRCLKTSGRFVVEKKENKKLYRNRAFNTDFVLDAVAKHKEVCASKGLELVKKTRKSTVTSFLAPTGGRVYVKELANRGWVRFLQSLFYVPHGKRAWRASHRLLLLGAPTAEPIALVEEFSHGFLRSSYLVLKEIPEATPLNLFLQKRYFRVSGALSREKVFEKRELIRRGSNALREFHAKNIYHKDFSGKNILVRVDEDSNATFYCVDTDSIQFPRRVSLRRRTKNLAQLNGLPTCITTFDRLRFYKEYFGLETMDRRHRLLLWIVRLRSSRRFLITRRIDQQLREASSPGAESYEDITSL